MPFPLYPISFCVSEMCTWTQRVLLGCLEVYKVADCSFLLIQEISLASKLKFDSLNPPLMKTSQISSANCSNFSEKAKEFLSCSGDIWQLKILHSWKHWQCFGGWLGSSDHCPSWWEVHSKLTEEYNLCDSHHFLHVIRRILRLGYKERNRKKPCTN